MSDNTFNCCLCGQEWQKDAGYMDKDNNCLCYECIIQGAAGLVGGKYQLRQLMTSNTPKNTTGFEEKLQLLEQWRNFHWQTALYYRSLGIPDNMEDSVAIADTYNTAMQIITGEYTVAPTITTHDRFKHIPYTEGEWPE